jgi:hypothetical protein
MFGNVAVVERQSGEQLRIGKENWNELQMRQGYGASKAFCSTLREVRKL